MGGCGVATLAQRFPALADSRLTDRSIEEGGGVYSISAGTSQSAVHVGRRRPVIHGEPVREILSGSPGTACGRDSVESKPRRRVTYAQHLSPKSRGTSRQLEPLAATCCGARNQAVDTPVIREIRSAAFAGCCPHFCASLSSPKKRNPLRPALFTA